MPKSIVASTASAFSENTVKLYIHLPPCFAAKPIEGIQEQLNGFLMRFVPQVDGVVLAHSDLELLQSSGRVMYDSPYSHFWISVKLLVWKPIKGSVLYGTINLQSPDHIGLLLYGTFNASIPSRLIPKDKYEFSNDLSKPRAKKAKADDSQEEDESSMDSFLNGEWVVKGTGESIGDEGVIGFEVAELVRTNDMLTVTGSLMGVPVTIRRPSMMIQPSCLENVPSSGQKKRSAPADDDDDSEANKDQALTESDRKRIKKEKKKADRSAESSSVPKAQETAAAPASEAKDAEVKKEKKDKKDKKEKKAKKAKTEA